MDTRSDPDRAIERLVILLIIAFFVFRIALAATLGLGVDESYGISVAHDLRLSYFDHPPLHYWIAHFFMPVLGDGRAARLPFDVIFIGTTWALYLLTRQLFGTIAGFWAVLALNLSAFFTLAGGWVLPDGPLMLSLVAAAYTIARALFPEHTPPSPWRTWIAAGIWIGIAALSKYHAVLFVGGLFIFVVSMPARRNILWHPAPWVGAMIALLIASPVIIWNAEHHWVSIAFQAGRANAHGFPKIRAVSCQYWRPNPLDAAMDFRPFGNRVLQCLAHGTWRRTVMVLPLSGDAGHNYLYCRTIVGRPRPTALANARLAHAVSGIG